LLLLALGHSPASGADFDVSTLPVPKGAQAIAVFPFSATYALTVPPAPAAEECERALTGQGWEPYGSAGETRYFKRGTTRVLATIGIEGGGKGRTMLSYASEAMSADLPLLPGAEGVQYSDVNKTLGFRSSMSPEEIAEWYRKALSTRGWFSKMEKPDKSDFTHEMIYRSPSDEMIRIEMRPAEAAGTLLTTVAYSTAAEVAAERKRVEGQRQALAGKIAAQGQSAKVVLKLPTETAGRALTGSELKFNLPAGKAKAAVQTMIQSLGSEGWTVSVSSLDGPAGSATLARGEGTLSFVYLDPGFMPAEVTVTPVGIEITLAEGKE
jgi:hypothetical protein